MANKWFENYLKNRKQYLEIYETQSDLLDIKCGIPQGSILGPILFLIYINDIGNSNKLNFLSFADDTTVYLSGQNYTHLIRDFKHWIKQYIYIWLCANRLSLNVNKTKYIIFNYTHSHNSYATNLHINNIPLTQVGTNFQEQTIQFLGIYIDEKLSWKRNISQICSKMARSIFFINKVKNILPTSALKILYYALVHCHIIYGIMVWGGAQTINKICILQKRAIRTICKHKYRDHTEPLFKKENILKINDVFKLHVNLFMYDYRQNHLPE